MKRLFVIACLTGTLLFAIVAAAAFAGWIKAGPSMLGALVLSGLTFCF